MRVWKGGFMVEAFRHYKFGPKIIFVVVRPSVVRRFRPLLSSVVVGRRPSSSVVVVRPSSSWSIVVRLPSSLPVVRRRHPLSDGMPSQQICAWVQTDGPQLLK